VKTYEKDRHNIGIFAGKYRKSVRRYRAGYTFVTFRGSYRNTIPSPKMGEDKGGFSLWIAMMYVLNVAYMTMILVVLVPR
jgi:hypothetical protein